MGEGQIIEDSGDEVKERTGADKHDWAPDAGKEGSEEGHKAGQNAFQGGGKSAGPAEGTQTSN
ncbi:MAG TPA: hypothetical protein VIJ69_09170 [Actinomycetota bacterium]|jgi:hypothetical protein